MSKNFLNLDEMKELTEPIGFQLKGEKFEVSGITSELLEKVQDLTEELSEKGENLETIHSEILSFMTGAPKDKFIGFDVRQTSAAINHIMASGMRALESTPQEKKRGRRR